MTIPEHIWLPIAVVVSVIAALAFWWWWPKWQVRHLALEIRDPKARADVEDNFRRTVANGAPTASPKSRRRCMMSAEMAMRHSERPFGEVGDIRRLQSPGASRVSPPTPG